MSEKPTLPVYVDLMAQRMGAIVDNNYVEYPVDGNLLKVFVTNFRCVTIGYWAAQIGLSGHVHNLLPKSTFSSLGFGKPTLAEKVEIISRMVEEVGNKSITE